MITALQDLPEPQTRMGRRDKPGDDEEEEDLGSTIEVLNRG
jgi:hypothetical protein